MGTIAVEDLPEWESAGEAVGKFVEDFPEVIVGTSWGNRSWSIRGKVFAWIRPFSKADLKRFGDLPPPAGPIVGIRVADLVEKEAILASGIPGIFTIEHFKNYAAVLAQFDVTPQRELRRLLVDGWLASAPRKLADEHASRLTAEPS